MSDQNEARLEARLDRLVAAVEALRERVDAHIDNHHGRWTFWRQNTLAATLGAVLVFTVEVLRKFLV